MRKLLLLSLASVWLLGTSWGCGDDDPVEEPPPSTQPDPLTGSLEVQANDACAGDVALEGATITVDGTDLTTDANGQIAVAELKPGDYAVTITMPGYFPETTTITVEEEQVSTDAVTLRCHSKAVGDRARDYLAGLSIDGAYGPVTKAGGVFDNFMDGDTTNDPVVLSVRSADHYALGHVPGAINIPWKTVADDASLALLGEPDPDARFVDYCYTGHTGGIAAGVLNLLGYPTANVKYGFAVWTFDLAARTEYAVYPNQTSDFTVETTINEPSDSYELPWLELGDVADDWEATQAAAQAYLGDEEMKPVTPPQALFDNLNDGDATNDPFIISVRSADHYALGHVPGAINIPWKSIALEENLAKIPTDRDIVVYCYTGHTGGIATSVLGTLGYHRVSNMKYGLAGWSLDADVVVAAPFDETTDANDFPIVTGTDPGTF